jgi:hypothetical protein
MGLIVESNKDTSGSGSEKHRSKARQTRLPDLKILAMKVLLDLTEWTPSELESIKHDRLLQNYMKHQRAQLDGLERDFPGLKQGLQRLFRGIADERDDPDCGPSKKGHSR